MKSFLLIVALVVLAMHFAIGQDAVKRRLPLAVSHLSEANKAVLRRKAAPQHNIFTKILCFKKVCRGFIGWRTRQKKQRFKGYQDGGKLPRPPKQQPESPKEIISRSDTLAITSAIPNSRDTLLITKEQVFILDEVLFEVNSSRLNPKFTFRLDSLIGLLTRNESLVTEISGHTDSTGTESHNLKLSKARAAAVAEYLIKNKVARERITHEGYGSSKPLAGNATENSRQKNRRVEILISEKNK